MMRTEILLQQLIRTGYKALEILFPSWLTISSTVPRSYTCAAQSRAGPRASVGERDSGEAAGYHHNPTVGLETTSQAGRLVHSGFDIEN